MDADSAACYPRRVVLAHGTYSLGSTTQAGAAYRAASVNFLGRERGAHLASLDRYPGAGGDDAYPLTPTPPGYRVHLRVSASSGTAPYATLPDRLAIPLFLSAVDTLHPRGVKQPYADVNQLTIPQLSREEPADAKWAPTGVNHGAAAEPPHTGTVPQIAGNDTPRSLLASRQRLSVDLAPLLSAGPVATVDLTELAGEARFISAHMRAWWSTHTAYLIEDRRYAVDWQVVAIHPDDAPPCIPPHNYAYTIPCESTVNRAAGTALQSRTPTSSAFRGFIQLPAGAWRLSAHNAGGVTLRAGYRVRAGASIVTEATLTAPALGGVDDLDPSVILSADGVVEMYAAGSDAAGPPALLSLSRAYEPA